MDKSLKLTDAILQELLLEIDYLKNNINDKQKIETKIEYIEWYIEQLIYIRDLEQHKQNNKLFTPEQEKYIIELVVNHLNKETQNAFNNLPEDIKKEYMRSRSNLNNIIVGIKNS